MASLPSPASGRAAPRHFTVAAAGDILVHGRVAQLAQTNAGAAGGWDFEPMLEAVSPWLESADIAICHLEGTISSTNRGLSYYPRFSAPRQIADAIADAGWDACSTAGNHAIDLGFDGIVSTLDQLDRAGVGHSGTARNEAERFPPIYEVSGVRVAHLSFSQHFNGLSAGAERGWAANQIDVATILQDARWARDQGAEFVVVSLHWGSEYTVDPTGYQHEVAEALLTDPAVDLIIGHHAHIVQPIGMIAGKYVVYGLGNHVSNQNPIWGPQYYATNDGAIVLVSVAEQDDGSFAVAHIDLIPTWVRFSDLRVFSAADAILTGAGPEGTLQASFDRTMSRLTRLAAPGVSPAPNPFPAVACAGRRATVLGTDRSEILIGTTEGDVIVAGAGNDVVLAGGGPDVVCGGDGNDFIDAGTGRDRAYGGDGNDRIRGAGKMSLFFGEAGRDSCSGTIVADCERR